jgi:nucleoside-triphosphatase
MSARIVILTGERGVGKTTVCQRVVALARAEQGCTHRDVLIQYTCGGLITLTHPDGSRDVLDVGSGDVRRLTLPPASDQGVVQGCFRFDPETLAWGNDMLSRILACDLLVVDELGPLEIERGGGWARALDVLRDASFRLALVVVRPELVVQAQLRLPTSATTVFTVTLENRDSLPEGLVQILHGQEY